MKSSSRATFVRLFMCAWLAFALLGSAWALATPIGGAPDDPAHLIKAAAVARGELSGQPVAGGLRVHVPEYIAFSQSDTCFAFETKVTPICAPRDTVRPSRTVDAVTSAGLYNPVYYALVGWPSLLTSSDAGIFGMRIVSCLIEGLFLALSFALIAQWKRRTLPLIGFVTAITPMVLFLDGNVNPNGLEIAAMLAAFTTVLTIVREPTRELLAMRAAIVFVSAAIAVNMRGLSPLWLAVAVLSPLILLSKEELYALLRTKPIRLAIAGTAVASLAAVAWLLSSNSLGAAPLGSGSAAGAPGVGTSHLAGFAWNLGSTFYYGEQIVGVFGWLDTPSPPFTYFVWSLLVGGLILAAISVLRGRALRFAGALTAALIFLPPLVQGIYITTGGLIWQGRYILPVFVCAVVGLGAVLSDRLPMPMNVVSRLWPVVVTLWALAQFLDFLTTLKRYAVGDGSGWPSLLHPTWSPPGGVAILVGAYLTVCLIACVALSRLAAPVTAPSNATPAELNRE